MRPDELVARYPTLHHVAEGGSWPNIRRLGLLTTAQLVEACDLDTERREDTTGFA